MFDLAFLGVTLMHGGMFATASTTPIQAIRRIAPFNLAGAALVLTAAFVDVDWRWVCWLAAVIAVTSSGLFGASRGWTVSATHFVERHGLVIIAALGESVVAIGVGAAGQPIDGGLAATALLALALSATLWWLYFDRDDEAAAAVMAATAGDRRSHLGMLFAYSHLVMVAGIVVMAAGVKSIVAHPTEAAETAGAWNLSAGVAVYILGDAAFRHSLGLGRSVRRLVVAGLVLLTAPVGAKASGVAQLAAAVVLMIVLIVTERRRAASESTARG